MKQKQAEVEAKKLAEERRRYTLKVTFHIVSAVFLCLLTV